MDRLSSRRRRVGNRPRQGPLKPSGNTIRRRTRLATRRNRRFVPRRNRLARAQNNQNRSGGLRNRFRRFNFFNRRPNLRRRIIFVGGLPNRITNRTLFQLFRPEGRIIAYRVMKNRAGFSRGFGFVEFARPRDALRSIQKWNNTTLDRNIITVRFRRRRNFTQRRFGFGNNNFNNRNNGRFNQRGRSFGFRGGRGGFRPRGRY